MNAPNQKNIDHCVVLANMAAYDKNGVANYIDGAPHIKHKSLRELYARLLTDALRKAGETKSTRLHVLDLGAGEGAVTLPMLELGARVTAVDVSREQLVALETKCSVHKCNITTVCEDVISYLHTNKEMYDVITANSLLHHIPDYVKLAQSAAQRLNPGGVFFSFQDPLAYRTLPFYVRALDKLFYFIWRIRRKDALGGLMRYLRRSRGVYLGDSAHDNAEYHVVRSGVDSESIKTTFEKNGLLCEVISYYSSQDAWAQAVGEKLNFKNTFSLVAIKPLFLRN